MAKKHTVTSTAHLRRRVAFYIDNAFPMPYDAFCRKVDAAKESGYTTVDLHIAWYNAEKTHRTYSFAHYDKQISYILSQGLDVMLTLDLQRKAHTFDGVRVCTDTVITTDEFARVKDAGDPFLPLDAAPHDTLVISLASRKSTGAAVIFYRDAAKHFVEKFGNRIISVCPTLTPCGTSAYAEALDTDGSVHMLRAYRNFLSETYKKIQDLNAELGTAYASFDEITLPLADDTDDAGLLYYQCRHALLISFIDTLAEEHKAVARHTRFALKFGNLWGEEGARTCTYAFADIALKAELVLANGGSADECAFLCDLMASAFAGKDTAFGVCYDADAKAEGDILSSGMCAYRHNATFLCVKGEAQGALATALLAPYADKKHAECVEEDSENTNWLEIGLYDLFTMGGEGCLEAYRLYTDDGVRFGHIAVTDDLTARALPFSIKGKKAKTEKNLPPDSNAPAERMHRKATATVSAAAALGAAACILVTGFISWVVKKSIEVHNAQNDED